MNNPSSPWLHKLCIERNIGHEERVIYYYEYGTSSSRCHHGKLFHAVRLLLDRGFYCMRPWVSVFTCCCKITSPHGGLYSVGKTIEKSTTSNAANVDRRRWSCYTLWAQICSYFSYASLTSSCKIGKMLKTLCSRRSMAIGAIRQCPIDGFANSGIPIRRGGMYVEHDLEVALSFLACAFNAVQLPENHDCQAAEVVIERRPVADFCKHGHARRGLIDQFGSFCVVGRLKRTLHQESQMPEG